MWRYCSTIASPTIRIDRVENAALKTPLLKTPLWHLHQSLGGKMVPFAGYDMPVQYDGMGVMQEHIHTRTKAGIFDVSHMGQCVLTGDVDSLEKIVPGDIQNLKPGKMLYTLLLNDQGGIVDDMIVTRWDEKTLFVVVNAACKEKDFAYLRQKLPGAKLDELGNRALIAVQGPLAEKIVTKVFPEAATLTFMTSLTKNDFIVSRCGYTGEDGFEISLPGAIAADFTKELLTDDDVRMIGLGARDSLRLEAGLCLYGHDIDDTTTPFEANLKWTVPKRRREAKDFIGAEKALASPARLRVGIQPEGKAPLREGTELVDDTGRRIGVITSGGFGPTFDAPVAMGYVETAFARTGTKINAMLRGTPRPAAVADLPFVPQKYKKG